ncbi:MAG: hypothetical protein IIA59_13025 [Candidatus Marinimicrobia bacterium]|nr:hypothetical protein [Candidatus Neomarinimicrobiota bacterium]
MKNLKYATMLGLFFTVGCLDSIVVKNENSASKEQVVVTPGDVENLIGGAYRSFWFSMEDWYGGLGLSTVADELSSSWGNVGMKDMSSEPRVAFNNVTSYGEINHVEEPWFGIYGSLAAVNDGLRAIFDADNPVKIGDNGKDNDRAIAYARLLQGISYGYLAAVFDQAYVVDETTDLEALAADPTIAPLKPYTEVMEAAIGYFQAAIDVAGAAAPFVTEDTWVNGYPMDNALLAQVANSFIARYTAAVARTPAKRAAIDWNAVKTRVAAGLTTADDDFGPFADVYVSWWSDLRWVAANHIWTRADYHTIGLTDNSGNYDNWLGTPTASRTEFVITTDDRRIHGASPDTSIADPDTVDGVITIDTTITPANQTPGTKFEFAGGSIFQPSRGTYHFSMYHHTEWTDYQINVDSKMTTLSYVEMQLLLAEALWRTNDLAGAAAIVNVTREAAGLTALTGSETDFFKWLIYEKKIETYVKATGLAYFDRRGWTNSSGEASQVSELISGTPVHYPVPAKELEIGGFLVYSWGGSAGTPGSAGKAIRHTPISRRIRE